MTTRTMEPQWKLMGGSVYKRRLVHRLDGVDTYAYSLAKGSDVSTMLPILRANVVKGR